QADAEIQQRARRLFVEYGYLDEAIHALLDTDPAERIAAARILGEFGSDFATPALVATLLDNEPKVRNAAAAALMQIGDRPATAEQTPQPSPGHESTPLPPTQTE